MQHEELLSFLHLVWACCWTPSLQDFQCRSGYHREETEIDWEEPPLTTGYHQHICDNHTRGDISSQRGAESTVWTGLAQGLNPVEPWTEGGWERTRRCQPSQTVHGPLNRTHTSKAQCQKSLCNNIGWSSMSNAALRSSKASTETSLSSAFLRRPSITLSRAVSVLWF